MSVAPRCCICGRRLRTMHWICAPCKREHAIANQYPHWPEWARFLRIQEERRRTAGSSRDVSLDTVTERYPRPASQPGLYDHANRAAAYANAIRADWPEMQHPTEVERRLRAREDVDVCSGLAYAPYPTEPENRAYRAANGIPERA